MPAQREYIVARLIDKNKPSSGAFTIPSKMMRKINPDAAFVAEWHEDGILYRYVGRVSELQNQIPDWASP